MALPFEAAAQDDAPPTLVKHLRSELQSKDAMRRDLALLDINALAHCGGSCTVSLHSIQGKKIRVENETGMGSVMDLDALIPDLLKSYRSGPADGDRLLALSALLHIGNEGALKQLLAEERSQSKQVKRATQRGLALFYLQKYPELVEQAQRTRRLSLDEVAQAKAYRMRKMKKRSGE